MQQLVLLPQWVLQQRVLPQQMSQQQELPVLVLSPLTHHDNNPQVWHCHTHQEELDLLEAAPIALSPAETVPLLLLLLHALFQLQQPCSQRQNQVLAL